MERLSERIRKKTAKKIKGWSVQRVAGKCYTCSPLIASKFGQTF